MLIVSSSIGVFFLGCNITKVFSSCGFPHLLMDLLLAILLILEVFVMNFHESFFFKVMLFQRMLFMLVARSPFCSSLLIILFRLSCDVHLCNITKMLHPV